ncbi:nuclear transport factor 2 family protein [Streptosporangium canum]|uniref:nuclear transport factor 2 family protein n=1 Tax=Streptosporangium canum TaxID=324952 RepID=UPI0037BC5C83
MAGWGVWVVFILLDVFGMLGQVDEKLLNIIPFTHVPWVVLGQMATAPLVGLTAVAAVLAALGVVGLLGLWRRAFDEHRAADLASLFTEDALFQGIGPRLLVGPAEISGYYGDVAAGTTADVKVLRGNPLCEGMVGGFAEVTFTARTGETYPILLSVVAQRVAGTWLISQYHAGPHSRDVEMI